MPTAGIAVKGDGRSSRGRRAVRGHILLGVASLDMPDGRARPRLALQLNSPTAGSSHDVHGALGCFRDTRGRVPLAPFPTSDSLDTDGWAETEGASQWLTIRVLAVTTEAR